MNFVNSKTKSSNPVFWWDERTKSGVEKSNNDLLLRSTGDGYIAAFSEGCDEKIALEHLTQIHTYVNAKHSVKLGINKGKNYIVKDTNERVNIIGWGINYAARALG